MWMLKIETMLVTEKAEITSSNSDEVTEKTLFFEVSAKSGAGVDNMMYNCIAKLSFFQEFKVENEEKLIKDLIESNSKGGNDAKMNNADMAKNFVVQADENSSNFGLNNPINNKNEEIKKKCGC